MSYAATPSEALGFGFILPTGTDPIREGDDVITRNALAAAGAVDAALRTVDNLTVRVTTLAPDAAPTATVTGAIPRKTIELGIPAGAKGERGEAGMGYAEGAALLARAESAESLAQQAAKAAEAAQATALLPAAEVIAAALANPDTPAGALARMMPRYVAGGQPGGQQGAAGANLVAGYIGNVIADDVSGSVIAGGGTGTSAGPGYANVIGRGIPENVGTGLPNYDPADLTKLRGTSATVSAILAGYDNLNSGLASIIASQHGYVAESATHAGIIAGSYHKILAGDYSFIAGGTDSTVEAGLSQIALGRGIKMRGSGYNLAAGINQTVDGQANTVAGTSSTVTGSFNTAFGALHQVTTSEATALGREHVVTGSGGTALGKLNKVSGVRGLAVGESSEAAGAQSVAMGLRCKATGPNSYAHGRDAIASVDGQEAFATGAFTTPGDAQSSRFTLRAITTSAASTVIGTNGGSIGQWLRPGSAAVFHATVVAYDPSTGDSKAWTLTGLVRQGATGAATLVAPATVTVTGATAGAAAWGAAIVPGTRSISVRAIGEDAKTIRWSGLLATTEVSS